MYVLLAVSIQHHSQPSSDVFLPDQKYYIYYGSISFEFGGLKFEKRFIILSRRRRKDNIKMDLTEVGWEDTNWIDLIQHRNGLRALLNAVMNLWVP
jgi:hypothetical protein